MRKERVKELMGKSRSRNRVCKRVCTRWSVYDKALCGNTTRGKVPLWVCHGQRKLAEWGRKEKREREIFLGLWDTVILIKSRRAEKESWEIKSVQHCRTHVAKHGKNNRGKGDKRMKPTPQSQYTDMDFFLSYRRSCWGLCSLSLSCPIPRLSPSVVSPRLTLSKLMKTLLDWENCMRATSQTRNGGQSSTECPGTFMLEWNRWKDLQHKVTI